MDYISLRDEDSFKYLVNIGLKEEDMKLRSDPVFLLKPDMDEARVILNKIGLEGDFMVLNLRPWAKEDEFIEKISVAMKRFMDEGHKVLLLPMHLSKDTDVLKKLESKLSHENLYAYYDEMSVRTLMGIISAAKEVVSMRLHGLIYSVAVETKPFALSYDPKVDGFMKDIGSKYIVDINNFTVDDLYERIVAFEKDGEYLENISKDERKRQSLARQNAEEVLEILGDFDE